MFQRFVDDELARAPALAERCLQGTRTVLRDPALADPLARLGAEWQRAFLASLARRVAEEEAADTQSGAGGGGLELMDESRVEVDIEISRAMQLIDTTAEFELRELQTFTSTLKGLKHVSAESNPFRPLVFASALWDAACVVVSSQSQRAAVLRASAGVMAGLLKTAWAAAATRLESQGVEPGTYRTVLLTPGSVPSRHATAPGGEAAPARGAAPNALATLLAAWPAGRGAAPAPAAEDGAPALRFTGTFAGPTPTGAEFEQALRRLDEMLQHLAVPPGAGAGSAAATGATGATSGSGSGAGGGGGAAAGDGERRLAAQRAALVASAGAGASMERRVIELLTRLFDTLLTDPQLPEPLRTAVARMQVPAMRIALRDPALVASTRHPLWQWIDRLGEAAAAQPATLDTLRAHAEHAADALARLPQPDEIACRRTLEKLEQHLEAQWRERLDAARPAIDNLGQAERREQLEQTLAQRIADQFGGTRVSPSIRRFMTTTWARVLADAMLQHGDAHETTRGHIKLVDELLWSVQLPDHPQSRQRLLALLPGLLQRLRAGMAAVHVPAPEQQAILDELMAIHTEALRPGQKQGADLTAAQLVQRMREEVVPDAPASQGFSDSLIDLASMETVPAELMHTDFGTPDPAIDDGAAERARRIDALRPGEALRLFVQGRWQRVRLLWRSPQGGYFLFAGDAARNHSITRRALERLAAARLMEPPAGISLVQRAIDALSREVRPAG